MNGLELGAEALRLWRTGPRGAESLDQQCQRMSGYYTQWAYQGNEVGIKTYGSANAAADASPRDGSLVNEMPVGGFGYWTIGKYGHVAMCIGYDGKRALILHTSQLGDEVTRLDPFWRVSHADTYPHPFKFWSFTNGKNPRMTVAPWSPNPVPGPKQRLTGADGVHMRLDPSTGQESQGLIPPSTLIDMVAFTDAGGNVAGNSRWFKSENGFWFWSGAFTSSAKTGLTDLTPKLEPEKPVDPIVPDPKPEPEEPVVLDPKPEEPSDPEPPKPPISEGVTVALGAIPQVEVADGALGSIIESTKTRKLVYTVWVIIGLVLTALTAGLIAGAAAAAVAAEQELPAPAAVGITVLAGIAGAYGALSPQMAMLARANIPKP